MKHYLFLILCLFSSVVSAQPQKESTGNFEFGTLSGPCLEENSPNCTIYFKKKYIDPLVFIMPSFSAPININKDIFYPSHEESIKNKKCKNKRHKLACEDATKKFESKLKEYKQFNEDWNDAPATLKITSLDNEKAVIRQFFAPYNSNYLTLLSAGECKGKSWCIEKKPMLNISYFVIDNNSNVDLGNAGQIISSSETVNKYVKYAEAINDKTGKKINSKIGIENYGLIVQAQAPKDTNELPPSGVFNEKGYRHKWFIAGGVKKDNTAYLALDRGETILPFKTDKSSWINSTQTVAYLLVKGHGQYKGLLFSLGQGKTNKTLGDDKLYSGFNNVTLSPEKQCNNGLVKINHGDDFIDKPLILASRNSRNGTDGGIFRLCRQTIKKPYRVSFVIDEDLNEPRRGDEDEACGGQDCIERRHDNESYGFMAFQRVNPTNTCDLFKGPAQTWDDSRFLLLDNKSKINNAFLYNKKRYLGFSKIRGTDFKTACNGNKCYPLSSLMVKKVAISDIPTNGQDKRISKNETWRNGGIFKNVDYERRGLTLTLFSGDYYFNSLVIGNHNKVIIPKGQNVRIYTHYFNMSDGSSFESQDLILNNGNISTVVFVKNGGVKPSTFLDNVDINKAFFKGYLYSERLVDLSNKSEINGAVTAIGIQLHNNSVINGSLDKCFNSTPNYDLTITPENKTNTLCENQPVQFDIQATDGSFIAYNGNVNVIIKSKFGGIWSTKSDFSKIKEFKTEELFQLPVHNNQAKFWFRANGAEKITVSGSIYQMEDTAPLGEYSFIPGGFQVTKLTNDDIIAGKRFPVDIKAVSCPTDSQPKVITDYNGSKILRFTTQYEQPTTPDYEENKNGILDRSRPIKVEIMNHGGVTDQANIHFTAGKSEELSLRYRDAGVLKWQVTDPNCTPENCSLINNKTQQDKKFKQVLSYGLVGSMSIKSRPWTFAICPLTFNGKNKYDNASGTSNGGEAYTAAGKPFDIVAKPLIWQIGDPDSESAMVDVSEQTYCNRPVTQNFFAKDAPSLNTGVTLSNGGLDSPNNGQKGVFSSQPQTDNSQQEFNGLLIADNSWSEVGSLWVNANLTNYLGMTVNSSKRHIGRFFPAYFGLTHNQLTPAMTSFTYMGQPFPVHWTVNAFNQQGKALDNYDQFAETLTAKFGFVVKNNNGGDDQRLLLQDPIPEKWSHNTANSHSYINYQSNVTYARKGFLSIPLITSPDGPDELWQLWLNLLNPSDNRPIDSPRLLTSELCSSKDGCTNPTVQKVISLRIGNQNPMRYGRMALQDAAGDIGKSLTIPLRVEYWNGAEFVTNSDDSASTFDGANYCRQILIQEPVPHTPNNPTTSGAGTVNLGQPLLSQLMANPDGDFKQQIRFWQRLSAFTKPTKIAKTPKIYCKDSASNQPWLSYNWRGIGDEDPSATVTFGVYHGNNRIIYRGETNDAGQSIPYLNYQ
ncbi:DUF6701 domain-containing protein [Photobacterium carnosum]|uniref:DUF6701 domain-containing protein n=1 Tax=Photobacterium carnosum TaxID=2023717 RepID=A0A2N4UT51_9GAMM|nr:DUF6701 domain-containing protein [Photobacterium carnosum]PLC58202.1 hypothetical protein CIK00_08620 [Photobacterium carnosum]